MDGELHKRHYGLKSNLAVFWCLNSARRRQQLEEIMPADDLRFIALAVGGMVPRFKAAQSAAAVLLGL